MHNRNRSCKAKEKPNWKNSDLRVLKLTLLSNKIISFLQSFHNDEDWIILSSYFENNFIHFLIHIDRNNKINFVFTCNSSKGRTYFNNEDSNKQLLTSENNYERANGYIGDRQLSVQSFFDARLMHIEDYTRIIKKTIKFFGISSFC